ncbi:hypothetical protein DFH27DRAFT_348919 [Peziza echinospora]|nr:hypothetical protein DFH27DRAFT_348919 [Peziza echinospora]
MVTANLALYKVLDLNQKKVAPMEAAQKIEFDPSELDPDDERSQEFSSVPYIFPELNILDAYSASILINVSTDSPIPVGFGESQEDVAEIHKLSHLPPILLKIRLPDGYPTEKPPQMELESEWIPRDVKLKLEAEIYRRWRDTRDYVLYDTIDILQQEAKQGFGLLDRAKEQDIALLLQQDLEEGFIAFNKKIIKDIFNQGTYSCGVCLEPKKGFACHSLYPCGHIFCTGCLQDFYTSCITEGEVSSVKCLDVSCILNKKPPKAPAPIVQAEDDDATAAPPKAVIAPTLRPEELEEIGISDDLVTRYRLLKRKAALEADPATIYCPRAWCKAPSRWSLAEVEKQIGTRDFYLTEKHYEDKKAALLNPPPPVESEEIKQVVEENISENPEAPEVPETPTKEERLDCCSSCGYAFCNVCWRGWHGEFVHCRPVPLVLTEEDIASMKYMETFAAHCPTCDAPVVKSAGCNHMICKCATHFCFLCSSYLEPGNPYKHFNNESLPCYMKLWEGEEGDGMGGRAPRINDPNHIEDW